MRIFAPHMPPSAIRFGIFICLTMLVLPAALRGQDNAADSTQEEKVWSHAALGRFRGDSIELRWAPATYAIWKHAAENGWTLERIELSRNPGNTDDPTPISGEDQFRDIGANPIMPWREDEWQKRVAKTDSNTAVALQLLLTEPALPVGSDPLAIMKKLSEEQASAHGFAMMAADFSKITAQALGLRYVDRNIKAGKTYIYRLYIKTPLEGVKLDTMEWLVDTREVYVPVPVQKVFMEYGDGELAVHWIQMNDGFFSAYDIERSEDKKNWKKLNPKPYVPGQSPNGEGSHFFVDTTITGNYKRYFYRVCGYTPFGEKGAWSEIVSEQARDLKAPAPAYGIRAMDVGMNSVKVSWDAFATESDLKGFYVGKSSVAAGVFEKISTLLPIRTREFIDRKADPLNANYYVVFSVDTAGNESMSYVAYADLTDTIAPAKPTGLSAEADTLGNVFLTWNEGPELDIIGYRVYWANDPNAEFSQLTGDLVPGLNYVDSIELNTLTKKVYYRIAAVDHRYNHSEMSDILALGRPDRVAPVAPVIRDYSIEEGAIRFRWIPSSSNDVKQQILMRSTGDGEWNEYKVLGAAITTFTDNSLEKGQEYAYALVAVDDAGNRSEPSFPLRLTSRENGVRQGISNFSLVFDDKIAGAKLSWNNPAADATVMIYRNSGNGLVYYRSAAPGANSYTDRALPAPKVQVSYAVKIKYSDGSESALSEALLLAR
jgi:uncharacterized protein